MTEEITAEILINAYANGFFPMAENQDDPHIYWFAPELRGQLPISDLHISRNMKKFVRQTELRATYNQDFAAVIQNCADYRDEKRKETWINQKIIDLYCELHEMGFAHSVEIWEDDLLVGGLYGVSIGAAFMGEAMFSLRTNASKLALIYLAARLWRQNYEILDTQYINDHLVQFGCYEIEKEQYLKELKQAVMKPVSFYSEDEAAFSSGASSATKASSALSDVMAFLQSKTQTS